MNEFLLRPMRLTDIAAVYAIERIAYADPWDEALLRDCIRVGYDCWLIEDKDGIQGYAMMSLNKQGAHVLNIAVQPARRKQGFGQQLLNQLLMVARQKKATCMFLEVRESNTAAIKLYEKLGFNEIDRRLNYYPAPQGHEDALVFALQL